MRKLIFTLIGISFLLFWAIIYQGERRRVDIHTSEYEDIIPDFNESAVESFEIYHGNLPHERITVKRENNEWIVRSYKNIKADHQKINDLIHHINILQGELRSDSKKYFSDYLISDKEGLHLVLEGAGIKEHFIIGRDDAAGQGGFIRQAGGLKTYFVPVNLLGGLGIYGNSLDDRVDPDIFYDKKVFRFDNENISAITISNFSLDESPYVISLKKTGGKSVPGGWTINNNDIKVDGKQVEDYLNGLDAIESAGIDFVSGDFDYGFDNPAWEMTVEYHGSKPQRFLVGNYTSEAKAARYMSAEGSGILLTIAEYDFQALLKNKEQLLAQNAPSQI